MLSKGWELQQLSCASCHQATIHCNRPQSCCSGTASVKGLGQSFLSVQRPCWTTCRLSQPSGNCPASKDSNLESSSAAAGLCALFKACARPCCLICLQLLNRHDDQLSSAVCTFLHQQLFAPAHKGQTSGSDPDLESDGSDQPSLAEAAFVQPDVVEVLRQSAEGLSGTECAMLNRSPTISSPVKLPSMHSIFTLAVIF